MGADTPANRLKGQAEMNCGANNKIPIIGIIPTNQSENVIDLLKDVNKYGSNNRKLNSLIVGYIGDLVNILGLVLQKIFLLENCFLQHLL